MYMYTLLNHHHLPYKLETITITLAVYVYSGWDCTLNAHIQDQEPQVCHALAHKTANS
jgi:hypothetical protein